MATLLGHSRIRGLGYHVPEMRVATEVLEQFFELSHFGFPRGVIERVTGVKERRVSGPEQKPSDLAYLAVLDAMVQGKIGADELDVIVFASVSRDYQEPATAHVIQAQLAAQNAFVFDVSNACLSIFDGMMLVDSLIASGRVRKGLVCGGEQAGDLLRALAVEIRTMEDKETLAERLAMFTLGEAGAAVILEAKEPDDPRGFVAFERASRGQHYKLCTLESMDRPMVTDSGRLLDAGIALLASRFPAILEASGWTRDDIDVVIPHQVSLVATARGMDALGLPRERAHVVVQEYGNTASTAVPLALARAADSGRLEPGSKVLIAGLGSGVSIGLATMVW